MLPKRREGLGNLIGFNDLLGEFQFVGAISDGLRNCFFECLAKSMNCLQCRIERHATFVLDAIAELI